MTYGGWETEESTDVERTASSLLRLPLPPPDDDIDLDCPTLPRLVPLAAGSGPLVFPMVAVPEPRTPRWAIVAASVLAGGAAVLAAALALL